MVESGGQSVQFLHASLAFPQSLPMREDLRTAFAEEGSVVERTGGIPIGFQKLAGQPYE